MATDRRRFLRCLAAAALLALPPAVYAQQNKFAIEVPMLDPWVPPAVAEKAVIAPATQGEALRAQVRAKLKRRFDTAAAPDGTLTAAEMRPEEKNRVSHRGQALAELAAKMKAAGW